MPSRYVLYNAKIIQARPLWNQGNYDLEQHGPVNGMRLARKLGMISYRSAEEWQARVLAASMIQIPPTPITCSASTLRVESYLQNHAERFIGAFDAVVIYIFPVQWICSTLLIMAAVWPPALRIDH